MQSMDMPVHPKSAEALKIIDAVGLPACCRRPAPAAPAAPPLAPRAQIDAAMRPALPVGRRSSDTAAGAVLRRPSS